MAISTHKLDFESAMSKLEEIVRSLEKGELSLDEALACFQDGVNLARICNQRLQVVEGEVEILMEELEKNSQIDGDVNHELD